MTERKNLPAVIAAQELVATTEKRGSLAGRGLMALKKDNDALYRQARAVFERRDGINIENWNAADNPEIFSAFKIFQQLADQNYGKAYYPLSFLLESRCGVNEEDLTRANHYKQIAFEWCLANQTNEDAELWCDLGHMYNSGRGIEQDEEQAVYWYRKAAEQGYAPGQLMLGEMYSEGLGIEQDDTQAVYWYRKAAEQGEGWGQWKLGYMYRKGRGVEQNAVQAVYWFRKAAEQGGANEQWMLGRMHSGMYSDGNGVEQDDAQAVYWYRKAAEQGSAYRQRVLGQMYKGGCGVEQNDEQAVYWYRKAAEQGDDDAQEALRILGINWKK